MNKELTPLKAFEEIKKYLVKLQFHFLEEELGIIETALKDYAGFQIVFKLSNRNEGQKVSQKLRAFKIIKEKEIDVPLLKESDNVEDYNYWCREGSQLELVQYNLLKEMLS